VFRSENSVLRCCISKAERTFQVVNLFHICLLIATLILVVFLLNVLMSFTTDSYSGKTVSVQYAGLHNYVTEASPGAGSDRTWSSTR